MTTKKEGYIFARVLIITGNIPGSDGSYQHCLAIRDFEYDEEVDISWILKGLVDQIKDKKSTNGKPDKEKGI